MLRRLVTLLLAGAAGVGIAVLPATAANQTVHAKDDLTFSPETVTAAPGETVTWVNDGGVHNVHFDGEATGSPATASKTWKEPVTRTFQAEGTYRYYCDPHENAGMTGYVVVKKPSTMTTTTQTTPGTSPTPTPTATSPSPSPSPTGAPDSGSPAVTTLAASAKDGPFCVRRTTTCRRPGARLRLTVDPAGDIALFNAHVLRKAPGATRFVSFGRLSLALKRGTHEVRIQRTRSGKRLRPGRYRLTFTETFLRLPVTVSFRVR